MKNIQAEIITVGDELLYGQVIDTNSAFLGQELSGIGIRVMQITSVSDSPGHIKEALQNALQRADLVIMTGGLGPTKDDLTKHTLADFFNVPLVQFDEELEHINELVTRRGRELNELNRLQSHLPANCSPIRNSIGTAPGMWFELGNKVLVSMPGVPAEMKRLMVQALPKLKLHFQLTEIQHKVIHIVGIAEASLAEKLEDWENKLPENIKLAYLPANGVIRLRLTGFDDGSGKIQDQMKQHLSLLEQLIPEYIFGYDETTLEKELGRLLSSKGLMVSTAESCTGGYVAHRMTTVIGATSFFGGGVVAYHNEVKADQLNVSQKTLDKFGAVSEETAREMAEGIRKKLGTDIGISTTGIAGPGGGEQEKPVGTIWIGYSDKKESFAKLLQLTRDRELNIHLTCIALLNLVRQTLLARDKEQN